MQPPREADLVGGVVAAEEEWGASAEALAVPVVPAEGIPLAVGVDQVLVVPAVGAGSAEGEEALAAEVGEVAEPAAGRATAPR